MTIRNIRKGAGWAALGLLSIVPPMWQAAPHGLRTDTDEVLDPPVEDSDDRTQVTQLESPQLAGLESRDDRLVDPDDLGQRPLARAGIASGASDDLPELADSVGCVGFGAVTRGHEAVKHDALIADFRTFACT